MNRIRRDLEVFARWLGGDVLAAETLIVACDEGLTRFFRGKARPQDCEDLKQEVWERLLGRPPATLANGPRAYMFGIARNVLYRYYSQRSDRWDSLTTSLLELNPNLAVHAPHELGDWMSKAVLQRLPLADQILLETRYEHEFSLTEVAEANDIPLGTVKSRLHHAGKRLRELLQDRERRCDEHA